MEGRTAMTHVKDIMSTQLIVVSPDLPLRDLVDLLAAEHVGGAPVVSGGKPVGIITLDDVVSFQASLRGVPAVGPEESVWGEEPAAEPEEDEGTGSEPFLHAWSDAGADLTERFEEVSGPEWDFLAEHTVEEAMSRRLWTAAPGDTVEKAARKMSRAEVHRLLVMDAGRLPAIVTASGVARGAADGGR